MKVSSFIKAVIALLGGLATWGAAAALDDSISVVELFGLLPVIATALGVYVIPNSPVEPEPEPGVHFDDGQP